MAHYMIRVELHRATPQNYTDLANLLSRESIVDTIVATDGHTYKLPPAEYNASGNMTSSAVHDLVKKIANRTGCTNAVVVTACRIEDIAFSDLQLVSKGRNNDLR